MKSGCAEHPKTKELQRLMQAPLYRVIGVLEALWYMTTHYADDGHIMRLGAGKIESWMEWDGAPGELIKWLQWTGFIDDDGHVHDWLEHCPKYVADRLRKRVSRTGDVTKSRSLSATCPQMSAAVRKSPQMSPPTESGPTEPGPTQPNPTESVPDPVAPGLALHRVGSQPAGSVAGSDTGAVFSEPDSGDGSESESEGRYALPNAAWQRAKRAITEHRDAEGIEDFAHAVVMVLKPDSASESDYADARAFGRSLCRGDGARALVARMFDAFNDAKATVEQSGGWGAWRNRMTERFGAWSSRKQRKPA